MYRQYCLLPAPKHILKNYNSLNIHYVCAVIPSRLYSWRVCFYIYSDTASFCPFDADSDFCSIVEDKKVSAPDVALYGLHVIIPLMSSEVLKVSPPARQFPFRRS